MNRPPVAVDDPLAVAVIGMGLRVPGACDVDTFRHNLATGRVLIEQFQPVGADHGAVGAEGTLDGIEDFDHALFGMSRREASIIDPQHRLLLECAWHTLEHAGYRPRSLPGPAGVCVAAGLSSYLIRNLLTNQEIVEAFGGFGLLTRNDKDYASALLAHRLGLRGPAHAVASGCSSSLLAVHTAAIWLITGQCELALAGGVSVQVPQRQGTPAVGGIYSPTGRCRPFDVEADGTVGGSGVGLVVLRRLADAVRDGDHVWAVIRGSATNSTGAERASFTAPTVESQAAVIRDAVQAAGLQPDDVGMIEAHGTGTPLGDLIEVSALREALSGPDPWGNEPVCLLGSVKAALGHLDVAAGVVGLIKACLCVHDGTVAPQPSFERPRADLPLAGSRFRIPTRPGRWPTGEPRRAGVSSFGAGGANVHVVIEQAPSLVRSEPDVDPGAAPPRRLLAPLSAGSQAGLDSLIDATAAAVAGSLEPTGRRVRDLAHTLTVAREPGRVRTCLLLDADRGVAGRTASAEARARQIVFAFPGDGGLHEGIAAALHREDVAFAAALDECARVMRKANPAGPDVVALLTREASGRQIDAPETVQPVLFSLEYALAAALMAGGVRPAGLVGHSLGEVVAATLAGVLTLPEAARLITARAAAFSALPPGGMTALALPVEDCTDELLGTGDLSSAGELPASGEGAVSIAAVNGPEQTVLAGSEVALAAFERRAADRGLTVRRLSATRAYHSPALDPVLPGFAAAIAGLPARRPQLPMVSSCTGEWVDDALGIEHWVVQLRAPVQFAGALRVACTGADVMVVELGPGHALAGMLRQQPELAAVPVVPVAGLPTDPTGWTLTTGAGCMLRVSAELWSQGAPVALTSSGRRVAAPLTPLDPVRCWIEPDPGARLGLVDRIPTERLDPGRWLSAPSWRRAARRPEAVAGTDGAGAVLLLCRDDTQGDELVAELTGLGAPVVRVRPGPVAASLGDTDHVVRPDVESDLVELIRGLAADLAPHVVVHAWCLGEETGTAGFPLADLDRRLELGVHSVLSLAKAVELAHPGRALGFAVLTEGADDVQGDDLLHPDQATALAAAKAIGREHQHWRVRGIDLGAGTHRPPGSAIVAELRHGTEPRVALRGVHRWLPDLTPVQWDPPAVPAMNGPGHYLVVGAFGAVGSALTGWIAGPGVHLTLVTRSASWAEDPERTALVSSWLAAGAGVDVEVADVADLAAMTAVRDRALRRHGAVDGVVHAAGEPDRGGVVIARSRAETQRQLATKVRGGLVLDQLFAGPQLRFMLFNASIASVLYRLKFGEAGYVAASDFLLALAQYRAARRPGVTRAVAWTDWRESGMWFAARERLLNRYDAGPLAGFGPDGTNPLEHDVLQGLSVGEGLRVASGVLAGAEPVTLVSTVDLPALLAAHDRLDAVSHGELLERMGLRRHTVPAETPVPSPRNPEPASSSGGTVPTGGVPDSVAAVVTGAWTALLGDPGDGADDFFARGGDSLLALRLCARLRDLLGIEYPLSRLFANPTLAACIRDVEAVVGEPR